MANKPWERNYQQTPNASTKPWEQGFQSDDTQRPAQPKKTGGRIGEVAKDTGLSLLNSAMAVPESLVGIANIPTLGLAGKVVENAGLDFARAKEIANSMKSDRQQEVNRKVESAEGFLDTAGTMLSNPSSIYHGVLETLAPTFLGGAIGRGVKQATDTSTLKSSMIGQGAAAAGSAAEQYRQQTEDGTLSPKQAASAVGSGIGVGLFGGLGAKVGHKLGIGDIDSAIVDGTLRGGTRNLARNTAGNMITEGLLEELPQSMQEQMWENFAFDRPLLENAGAAAAQGMLLGGALGGAFGAGRSAANELAYRYPAENTEPDAAPGKVQPAPTPDNPTPSPVERPDPSNGPISRAANAMADAADTGPVQNWDQYNRPAVQRDTEAVQRGLQGLDGLIIATERMGFTDEVALLVTAKRLYQQAEQARAAGDEALAGQYAERGNRLYQSATETNEQIRTAAEQFPVPYVATGEITGGEVGPYQGPGRTGETFDQPSNVGGPAALELQQSNRLHDSGIIFGDEPADIRAAREQRQADDFSARYGQEGQTPFRADPLVGELDRSGELPPAQSQASLPPGTGQIEMGRDRPERTFTPVPSEHKGVGRNAIEREAQAKTRGLPQGNATRAITPEQYQALMERARIAARTPLSQRTPEMKQAIAMRQAVRSGEVSVGESPQATSPVVGAEAAVDAPQSQGDELLNAFLNPTEADLTQPAEAQTEQSAQVAPEVKRDIDHIDRLIEGRRKAIENLSGREYRANDSRVQLGDPDALSGDGPGARTMSIGDINERKRANNIRSLQQGIESLEKMKVAITEGRTSLKAESDRLHQLGSSGFARELNPDLAGLAFRSNGEPFSTPRSAKQSAAWRNIIKEGGRPEAVPVEGGFGIRNALQSTEQAAASQGVRATDANFNFTAIVRDAAGQPFHVNTRRNTRASIAPIVNGRPEIHSGNPTVDLSDYTFANEWWNSETNTIEQGESGAGAAPQEQAVRQTTEQAQSAPRSVSAVTKRNRNAVNEAEDSLLMAVAKLSGLDRKLAKKEGVDPAYFKMREGIRWVFRVKDGRSFDGMAEALEQYGYLDSADRHRDFHAKLFRSLAGESIYTAEGMYRQMENQAAEDANNAIVEAVEGRDEAALSDASEYVGLDGVSFEDLYLAQEFERADILGDELVQSMIDSPFPIDVVVDIFTGESNGQSESGARSEAGRNDQERRASEENTGRDTGRAGETGRERQANAPESEELLTSYSEQDLQAQAESQQASEQAALRTQAQAEQRAQADAEVSDFTLTGSNRPADVAASRGQNDMFGLSGSVRSEQPIAQQTKEARAEQIVAGLTDEKSIRAALDANMEDGDLLSEITSRLRRDNETRPIVLDWLEEMSSWLVESDNAFIARQAQTAQRRASGVDFKQSLLDSNNGDLAGVQLTDSSGERGAFFLPDASEPGRVRVSYFDKRGFFGHATRDTYAQALDEAFLDGYRSESNGLLESMMTSDEFNRGNEITSLIARVNEGQMTYAEFVEQARDLSAQTTEQAESFQYQAPLAVRDIDWVKMGTPTQGGVSYAARVSPEGRALTYGTIVDQGKEYPSGRFVTSDDTRHNTLPAAKQHEMGYINTRLREDKYLAPEASAQQAQSPTETAQADNPDAVTAGFTESELATYQAVKQIAKQSETVTDFMDRLKDTDGAELYTLSSIFAEVAEVNRKNTLRQFATQNSKQGAASIELDAQFQTFKKSRKPYRVKSGGVEQFRPKPGQARPADISDYNPGDVSLYHAAHQWGTGMDMHWAPTDRHDIRAVFASHEQAASPEYFARIMEWAERKGMRGTFDSTPSPDPKGTAVETAQTADQTPAAEQSAPDPITSGLAAHDAMLERMRNGELDNVADMQRVFDYLAENQEAVQAELNKQTKKQLMDRIGGHVYSDTKKADLVRRAMNELFDSFRFIGNQSGFITSTSYKLENKIADARDHIANLTDQQVAAYSGSVKETRDQRRAEMQDRIDRLRNPETLSDFRERIKVQGMGSLTPEQRAAYDRLVAEETISNRTPRRDTTRTGLQTDGRIELGDPVEAKHGKTGETIYNVNVITRLGKEAFKEAANFARSMGGGYYRNNFYFKTPEDAELFSGWVNGETVDTSANQANKAEERQAKTAERLKQMAERAEQRANEALNADRKENTLKRMGEGERARAKANAELRIAEVLKAVPDSDTVVLKGATQKVQIELLDRMANGLIYSAPESQVNKDRMSNRTFKEDVTPEQQVQHARMPLANMTVNTVRDLANDMLKTKGYVLAARGILKGVKGQQPNEYLQFNKKATLDKVLSFIEEHASQYSPLRDAAADYKRLERMGITNASTLRTALLEYMALRDSVGTRQESSRLGDLERNLQRTILGNRNAFNDFFPTPQEMAKEIVEMADIEPGMRVLEPSAGNGMLADAAREAGATVDVVEMGGQLRDILQEKGYTLVGNDFLAYQPTEGYDRIVMNPPFSNNEDIKHVRHAYEMLNPGGKLVAITSSMAGDRSNKVNQDFRSWLDDLAATEQMLPENAFMSSMNQTGARTKAILIDKPADAPDVRFSITQSQPSRKDVNDWSQEVAGRLGLETFFVSMNERTGTLTLDMIKVNNKKQGTGSKAIQELVDYADQHDLRVTLTPGLQDEIHGTTSRARLVRFYKRFGFVENKGRNKDFAISDGMYRNPEGSTRFSIDGRQSQPMAVADVQLQVENITSSWKNAPGITVVADESGLPKAIRDAAKRYGAEGTVNGVMYQGRAYIVADKMRDASDVERVLFHEALGHYGLRQLFGPHFDLAMDQLYNKLGGIDGIRKLSKRYGIDLSAYEGAQMDSANRRRMMVDEVIAHLAEKGDIQPTLVQRAANIVRKALRRLFGNTTLGQRLNEYSDAEVLRLVADARRVVTDGEVSMGGGSSATVFSLSNRAVQNRIDTLNKAIKDLMPKVDAAYDSGNFDVAENLDARLDAAMDELDSLLSAREEDGIAVASNEMEQQAIDAMLERAGDPTDMESSPAAMIAKSYYEAYVVNDRTNDWMDSEDKAQLLRGAFMDAGDHMGGFDSDAFTDQQLIDAAKDLYESRLATNERRKNKRSIGKSVDEGIRFSLSPQTQTEAFRKWFGDSKVVDANGDPLVVYHGTNADFTAFDGDLLYFTEDPQIAQSYGKTTVPAYLSIQNPIDLRDMNLAERVINEVDPSVIDPDAAGGVGEFGLILAIEYNKEGYARWARDNGYDGIILPTTRRQDEMLLADSPAYIALAPTQIKSATDNQGGFDPNNPDIRFSLADRIRQASARQRDDFVTNTGRIESRLKEFMKLRAVWDSASDVLKRTPELKPIGDAIDQFYDQTRENMGIVNRIIDPVAKRMRKAKKADRDAALQEFEAYMRARENGESTNGILGDLSQAMVDAWAEVADITGTMNQEAGVQVYDANIKGWRGIGKLRNFWPRSMNEKVQEALLHPSKHPDTWREMARVLHEDGRIEAPTYELASAYLGAQLNDMNDVTSQDYFAGIEKARGEALPDYFYDYSWDNAMAYKDRWAENLSRIEAFGQRAVTGKDMIDEIAGTINDDATLKFLKAAQDRVYNVVPNDSYVRGMTALNTLATGIQLGNPGTAMLNLIGGTSLNFQTFGFTNSIKGLASELKDMAKHMQEAREIGILIDDYQMLVQDAAEAGLSTNLQKFTSGMLKWGGYTPMETFIRTHAYVTSKTMLRQALDSWNSNIESKKSLKALAWYQRNGFNTDKLIAENGSGPETRRLYRKQVNMTQGSYRIDQTPIFVDSPIGKFLFKYQKFGTQLSRTFWINILKPFIDSVAKGGETVTYTRDGREYSARVRTFMPMLNFFGGAILSGTALALLREAVFGYQDPGPDLDEIEKALADDDTAYAVALAAKRAWSSMMAVGALGFFGNYVQMMKDVSDRQRVKSPLNPPAIAPLQALGDLALTYGEQGTLTAKDMDRFADTLSIYRTGKRASLAALSTVTDLDIAELEMARRDRNYIRKVARRYADDIGLENKRRAPDRYGKTEMSPINARLIDAVMLGQPERAKAIMRDHLSGLSTQQEIDSALTSMRGAIRAAQPVRVSISPSQRERREFLKWAEGRVSPDKFARMMELDDRFTETAIAAGLMNRVRERDITRQTRQNARATRDMTPAQVERYLRGKGL